MVLVGFWLVLVGFWLVLVGFELVLVGFGLVLVGFWLVLVDKLLRPSARGLPWHPLPMGKGIVLRTAPGGQKRASVIYF